MERRPSQRKLAIKLNLSPMTVSRALRGADGVGDELRTRILEAARDAGLATPVLARLRDDHGWLHVLCTMAPEPQKTADSPFHGRLLEGLHRGARECASEIVNCPEVNQTWPLVVVRRQVDGAILVWGDEHDLKPVENCPVPAIYVFYGPPTSDLITVDNFDGGFELGCHLVARGHRQVAFVGPDSRVANERLAGLRAGLHTGGGDLPPRLALLKRSGASGSADFIDELLASGGVGDSGLRSFTAVMAYNDFVATHLIARFKELGIRVPEDVSVVGFDGVVPINYKGPRLTTCAIPLEELGAEASRLLYWRLSHPTAVRRKLVLEASLIEGDTVASLQ